MRKGLRFLIVEQDSGEIGVQFFETSDSVTEPFDNLKGKFGDKPSRATLLTIEYAENKVVVSGEYKDLPVVEDVASRPDGYILGQGPINFEEKDEKKS